MPLFRDVPAPVWSLGVTQIIGFGTLYYAFSVAVPALTTDLGISLAQAYGAFSAALLAGGLAAPLAGRMLDRLGARRIMSAGSVMAALALVGLALVPGAVWLWAALIVLQLVTPLVLYDAAFAAITQAVGPARARRAITQMTLLGGFASTVFWPATLWLIDIWGWRDAYLVYAALHLLLCLPLHLSLPRSAAADPVGQAEPPRHPPLPMHLQRRGMILLAVSFTAAGAVYSALTAQWVPALMALGTSQAIAVTAGALMGPAQVGVRILEMTLGARHHPVVTALVSLGLLVVALAVLSLAPPGIWSASVFAVLFGLSQGLTSIVRGTVPLALFGARGYAARLGVLSGLRMTIGALAPLALALAISIIDPRAALAIAGGMALVATLILALIPWRQR